jgi:hypothetical protein
MGLEFAGADGDIPLSLYRPEKIEQLKGMGKQHMKAGHDEKMGSTLGLTVKEASRPSLFAKKVCHHRHHPPKAALTFTFWCIHRPTHPRKSFW